MNKKQALVAGGAAAVSLLMAIPAFAATDTTTPAPSQHAAHSGHFAGKGTHHKFPGVVGTVSAINGTTLTVVSKMASTTNTYTVDVSNAKLQKGFGKTATPITLANIAVNDRVAVQGTVSGASVTANTVIDGKNHAPHQKLANAAFGTVASVNGTSFTLTRKTQTGTSTVSIGTDSATTFKKNGQPDTLTDLAVGQRVVAMGAKDSSGNIADATSVNIMVRSAK